MRATDVIRRLHQHRGWVNGNLVNVARGLTAEQLNKQFEIGQGSIWKSLLHLYAAEYVWLEALLGNEKGCAPGDLPDQLPGNQQGEPKIVGITELGQKWSELEGRWTSYLASLADDSLNDTVSRVRANGQRLSTRRSDVLLHVCTHAHYTAAQVVNMMRHVKVAQLPDTMLMLLARQETL